MTSNQSYGSHYGRSQSSKKEMIGRTTLEFMIKNDKGNYVQTQENVAQRSRHGLFSQPMGTANGDQYHDAKRTRSLTQLTQYPRGCPSTSVWSKRWAPNCSRR